MRCPQTAFLCYNIINHFTVFFRSHMRPFYISRKSTKMICTAQAFSFHEDCAEWRAIMTTSADFTTIKQQALAAQFSKMNEMQRKAVFKTPNAARCRQPIDR